MRAGIEAIHDWHIEVHDNQPVYWVWACLIGAPGLKLGFEHIHSLFPVGSFVDLDLITIGLGVTPNLADLGSTV